MGGRGGGEIVVGFLGQFGLEVGTSHNCGLLGTKSPMNSIDSVVGDCPKVPAGCLIGRDGAEKENKQSIKIK